MVWVLATLAEHLSSTLVHMFSMVSDISASMTHQHECLSIEPQQQSCCDKDGLTVWGTCWHPPARVQSAPQKHVKRIQNYSSTQFRLDELVALLHYHVHNRYRTTMHGPIILLYTA